MRWLQWRWDMIKWNEPGHTWLEVPARITKTDRTRSIPLDETVSKLLHKRFLHDNKSRFCFPNRMKDAPTNELSHILAHGISL